MSFIKKLWAKTLEVSKLYMGTFIVVMIFNQLIFFGFCLNPVCIVAAMPHVLLITVLIGAAIQRMKSKNSAVINVATGAMNGLNNFMGEINNSLERFNKGSEATKLLREREMQLLEAKNREYDACINSKLSGGGVSVNESLIKEIDEELISIDREIAEIKKNLS